MRDDGETSVHAKPATPGLIPGTATWLTALRRYLIAIALGNLLWEFAQLPLYTIWHEGRTGEILFAVIHCTGGDILIASMALLGALIVAGNARWPNARFRPVTATAIVGGLDYTVFSEWLNTEIRGSWAYTELMPQLPLIGSGVSPLAQWIVVPMAAFWWARRPFATGQQPKENPL
ncbi:MAG: hypothetical protein BroJett029_04550 [Alphaproteobacteria bacterium]|nr:MAG: hypothetical protein BroJett029_04550 [Alphaproteobacteria bacterium]